jgi:hypothetical protein
MNSRRQFLAATSLVVPGLVLAQEPPKPKETKPIPKRPPAIPVDMVRDFVGVSHGKFDKVKEMLEKEPKLVNATYDWGGGDFETALGAASHVGNREIALFLLKNKARMDLFCATMLGQLEIVKTVLMLWPDALHVPGPHGIPLIQHANKGGKEAKPVYDYLTGLLEKK